MDPTIILTIAFAAAVIISAFFVYLEDTIFKSAIALAITFTLVSLALLLLNQTVIAVLQLLIIVGGVSTYLVVAVASETRKRAWPTDLRIFALLAIIVAAASIYLIAPYVPTISTSNPSIYSEFQQTLGQYGVVVYFIVLMMFVAAIGSVVAVKMGLKR